MKNIKKNILLAGAAILAIGSASVASAQVVNVQFAGNNGPSETFGTQYTGVGAIDTGTDWNQVDVTDTATPTVSLASGGLVTSTGGTSSDAVTLGNVQAFNEQQYNGGSLASGNNLMDSEALSPAQTGSVSGVSTFTIGGLTDGGTYNLYLYGVAGIATGDSASFTIDSVTKNVTGNSLTGQNPNTPPAGGWVTPGDYVEFAGVVADGSGDISGTWESIGGPTGDGAFNGLQIQSESMSVPEPSVTMLLGLSLMTLVVLRRARRIS